MAWKLLTESEFTAFPIQEESTVHCLQYVDEPTYLVHVEEVSSGDLERSSIAKPEEDSIQYLD